MRNIMLQQCPCSVFCFFAWLRSRFCVHPYPWAPQGSSAIRRQQALALASLRTLSLCFVLFSFLGNLAGVLGSPGCYSLLFLCAVCLCFRRVVSQRSVSLIGVLRTFPLCLRRFIFFLFIFFFGVNLWRQGSIPRRSWRLGAGSNATTTTIKTKTYCLSTRKCEHLTSCV